MKSTKRSWVSMMGDRQLKAARICRIISNECVNGAVYKLIFESGDIARTAAPGQFAMIKCGGGAYLRRPLSFCDVCEQSGSVALMYRASGVGTLAVSRLGAGDSLDVIGPLGNGFDIMQGKSVIVGGGIGSFPLLFLARRLHAAGAAPDIYTGFQDSSSVVLENEFMELSNNYYLASDDGSAGAKGFVTDMFSQALENGAIYDAVYACGPVPMLIALKRICERFGIGAQFSLEQRMGCGVGACRACACEVKYKAGGAEIAGSAEKTRGAENSWRIKKAGNNDNAGYNINDPYGKYVRVCCDGPVFSADAIILHET